MIRLNGTTVHLRAQIGVVSLRAIACVVGGVIGLSNAALAQSAATQPRWHLSSAPRLSLGGGTDLASEFLHVRATFRLSDGAVVVANGATRQLRVFGPAGEHRRDIGRDGSGPGEFRNLAWTGRRGDTLVVTDGANNRITEFLADGTLISTTRIPSLGVAGYLAGRFTNGSWLVSTSTQPTIEGPQRVYRDTVRLGILAPGLDIPVRWLGGFPGYSLIVVNPAGASHGVLTGVAPIGPGLAIATLGDRLLIGDTANDTVRVVDFGGKILAVFRLWIDPEPLTDNEVERVRKRLLEGDLARMPRNIADILLSRKLLPAMRPRYGNPVAEPDGTIWIPSFTLNPDEPRTYRIMDRSGRPLATMAGPPGFEIREIGPDYVLGVQTDSDGVERVQLYGLVRKP